MKQQTRRFWHSTDDGDEYLVEAVITQDYPQEGATPAQYSATINRVETKCGRDIHPADLLAEVREDIEYWALQADRAYGRFFVDEHLQAFRYYNECADAEDDAEKELQIANDRYDSALRKKRDARVQLLRIEKIKHERKAN